MRDPLWFTHYGEMLGRPLRHYPTLEEFIALLARLRWWAGYLDGIEFNNRPWRV